MFKHIPLHSISIDNQEEKRILRNFLFWYWSCHSCVRQTLIGSDMLLEPDIFAKHMIFIILKCHSYYPENLRSEAYGLNESHFSVKLWLGQTSLWNRRFSSGMIFIIPKCHSYCPENFRLEAYGLNRSVTSSWAKSFFWICCFSSKLSYHSYQQQVC